MAVLHLKRFTALVSHHVRLLSARLGNWIFTSPRLKLWFYPPVKLETAAERYRRFNGSYFADLHEQERMLSDQPRMAFYHGAITRHVKPGQRVIDLGTGTGILASYASRAGAAKVFAIDHSTIIEHARELAATNGIVKVEFIEQHSMDFELDQKVDVILHEQIGDFLFDEAMVPNVCDLRDRLLKPGGTILPSQFELFCEPVTLNDEYRIPYIWELNDVHGFDYTSMERSRPQNPEYYRLASCDLQMVKHFVGEPTPLVEVDLNTIQVDTVPLEIKMTREVKHAGKVDGLAVFMKAKVDDDLVLSSSPLDPGRAPHWGFRILRLDLTEVTVGDILEVTLTVQDWTDPDTWRWICDNKSR